MYRYMNKNSHNRHVNDCSIRAISAATNTTWNDAYKELSNEARKKGLMMDSVEFIEEYLDERYPRVCCYGMTVGEFLEENPIGIFLVTMKGHITVIIDGILYDTFDCRHRDMWCAWEVE